MKYEDPSKIIILTFNELTWFALFFFLWLVLPVENSTKNETPGKNEPDFVPVQSEPVQHSHQTPITSNTKEVKQPDEPEKSIRKELVALEGNLNRVVILFDSSGSMKEGGRWEQAINVVKTWITYLPINECALIVFNNDLRVFPE